MHGEVLVGVDVRAVVIGTSLWVRVLRRAVRRSVVVVRLAVGVPLDDPLHAAHGAVVAVRRVLGRRPGHLCGAAIDPVMLVRVGVVKLVPDVLAGRRADRIRPNFHRRARRSRAVVASARRAVASAGVRSLRAAVLAAVVAGAALVALAVREGPLRRGVARREARLGADAPHAAAGEQRLHPLARRVGRGGAQHERVRLQGHLEAVLHRLARARQHRAIRHQLHLAHRAELDPARGRQVLRLDVVQQEAVAHDEVALLPRRRRVERVRLLELEQVALVLARAVVQRRRRRLHVAARHIAGRRPVDLLGGRRDGLAVGWVDALVRQELVEAVASGRGHRRPGGWRGRKARRDDLAAGVNVRHDGRLAVVRRHDVHLDVCVLLGQVAVVRLADLPTSCMRWHELLEPGCERGGHGGVRSGAATSAELDGAVVRRSAAHLARR
mmetsp:Transcript_21876/g.76760  ORF Transcript_21876/g.76760 Transcript_21876/m.76760 type:complete len:440 (+) Transcript_21876:824-2143(+)